MDPVAQEFSDTIDMEHVADSALDEIAPGKIIKGEIVTFDSGFVYVNVGTKSDGRISIDEFDENPAVGSVIDVMLKGKRLVDGMYQFSKNMASSEKRWHDFTQALKDGQGTITGRVVSATNKGKIVNCDGISAFLPFSLTADLKAISSSDTVYNFKIKSVDEKKKSLVVSRKDLLEEELVTKWDSFTSKYKPGDRIMGEVIKFVEFGAFVRVEGIDALLHRNDMSWKKVFKQRKILKIGEQREFLILDYNREDGKISLGLKQLMDDPWLQVEQKFRPGEIINGRVVTLTAYGAFIEIEEGVEGFVSNGELSWTKNAVNIKDYFKKGDAATFMVLDINQDERKLVLGYKQTQPNPWNTIFERFPLHSVHTRKVKKIVKFGLFVELEEDIDGLVHISDVSWDDSIKDLNTIYKVGDEVTFKILDIKKDEMKISCGIKQINKSPWQVISEKYQPRMKVEGTISGITPFGLFVKLEDEVEGLVHISEVSRKRIENLEEYYKIGDHVGAMVLGVDVDKKRLSLSIKTFDMISEKEELDRIMKNTSPRTVTLGDMVNIKLGE